jgi:hypothetical protein
MNTTLVLVLHCLTAFLKVVDPSTPEIQPSMLSHTVINDNIVHTKVLERYAVSYWNGKVRIFGDREADINRIFSTVDPNEMYNLSIQPCVLTSDQSQDIACHLFECFGFKEGDFEPPQVQQSVYRNNPDGDGTLVPLPIFQIQWAFKGETLLRPRCLRMTISGTSGRLIYYSASSLP